MLPLGPGGEWGLVRGGRIWEARGRGGCQSPEAGRARAWDGSGGRGVGAREGLRLRGGRRLRGKRGGGSRGQEPRRSHATQESRGKLEEEASRL